MAGEKVLIVSDNLQGPTGFGVNAQGVAWSLADEYDVHVLGLQEVMDRKIILDIEGDPREVIQHRNYPRERELYDFGRRSLPVLLDNLKPDILITVNDIQMVEHVPSVLCPNSITLKVADLPAKKILDDATIQMHLEGELLKFKEKYPRDVKWIQYAPQDGEPPMPFWKQIYMTADKVIAMSKYGQYVFKQYFNMDVDYIWHGVDSAIFKPAEKPESLQDKFVVGDLNRNQPRKQPARLIEAFAKFAKDKDDVLLHLQMDWNDVFGYPIGYLVNLYGIGDKIIQPFQVGMPRKQIPQIYNMWNISVNPTAGEGFGLTTIEAAACGKPTVITDYTTSRELIMDGEPSPRGILVPYVTLFWERFNVAAVQRALIDIDKLVEALEFYYQNRDVMEEHGRNAREWAVKNVALRKLQHKWKAVVKEVLNS